MWEKCCKRGSPKGGDREREAGSHRMTHSSGYAGLFGGPSRERRLRELGMDPAAVKPLAPTSKGDHYSEARWRNVRNRIFRKIDANPTGDERALRRTYGQALIDGYIANGHGEAAAYELASVGLRNTPETVRRYYASLRTNRMRVLLARRGRRSTPPRGFVSLHTISGQSRRTDSRTRPRSPKAAHHCAAPVPF